MFFLFLISNHTNFKLSGRLPAAPIPKNKKSSHPVVSDRYRMLGKADEAHGLKKAISNKIL